MTTNTKGEIAQSDRGRLRALAQKRRVARAERREIMFELVVAGYERELIAQKLCVSLATVRREVEKAIDQRRLDAPDRYVRLQVTRLTKALRVVDDALQAVRSQSGRAPGQDRRRARPLSRAGGCHATNGRAVEPRRLSRSVAPLALTHAAPGLERSESSRGKLRRGNFPACNPLNYHKTGKLSRPSAMMKTPPAGSAR